MEHRRFDTTIGYWLPFLEPFRVSRSQRQNAKTPLVTRVLQRLPAGVSRGKWAFDDYGSEG